MTTISTSTSAFYDRASQDITSLRGQAEELQTSLSSGQRLTRSSDDPVAAARLRELSRADALSTIDTANAQRASTDLQLTDSALSSFADFITRAKDLATQAANGTLTTAQRSGIGTEIAAIRTDVLALANSRDSAGHALFGGETAGAAYSLTPTGAAQYDGTGSAGQLALGDGQSVSRGLTGPEFLNFTAKGTPTDLMAVLKTLADDLTSGSATGQATANAAIDQLNAGLDSVTTAQTIIGSRMAWIDLTTQRRTDLGQMRSTEEADVGGTDLAATVARLQETMTVLQASQASFAKLASLSLFDVIH